MSQGAAGSCKREGLPYLAGAPICSAVSASPAWVPPLALGQGHGLLELPGLAEQHVAKWNWLDSITGWETDGKLQQLGLRPHPGQLDPHSALYCGWGGGQERQIG